MASNKILVIHYVLEKDCTRLRVGDNCGIAVSIDVKCNEEKCAIVQEHLPQGHVILQACISHCRVSSLLLTHQ